jgi:hypothetical protein
MVWALDGRRCIVLPEALWPRLKPDGRDAVLIHELAHLKRGDHWVRLLELLVLGFFWWNPVAWWARKGLRQAEEECCDAWVAWALPDSGRAYARALVVALDFISMARAAEPVGASGIGRVTCLKRRLKMIVREQTPRGLSWAGRLAVFGLASLLLPLAPTWAQRPAADPETTQDPPAAETAELRQQEADVAHLRERLEHARAELEKARAEAERAQLDRRRAEERLRELAEHGRYDQLQNALKDRRETLSHSQGNKPDQPARGADPTSSQKATERKVLVDRLHAEAQSLEARLRAIRAQLAELESGGSYRNSVAQMLDSMRRVGDGDTDSERRLRLIEEKLNRLDRVFGEIKEGKIAPPAEDAPRAK